MSSIDSELMHPPTLPKVRPSSLPSRELLSSLALPPPTLLKDYLCPRSRREYGGVGWGSSERKGRGGPCDDDGGSDRPIAALTDNNLLWFSTRGSYMPLPNVILCERAQDDF